MDKSGLRLPAVSHTLLLAGLIFFSSMVHGQLTRPGNPLPLDYPGLKNVKVYNFEVSEEEKIKATPMQGESMLKPAHSGILIDTSLNPDNSGTWDTLADKSRIWRCGFHIEGARLVSLIFKPYQVKSGVRIFMYDPSQEKILGAFSDLNNKTNLVLATGQIPGETLIIEVQVPRYVDSPGLLTITSIGCDFTADINESLKDGWYGLSGNCNVDINCLNIPSYQQIKNAVVRIVYLGGERCTGTLLNNTRQDGRNYVLTAEHCIHTEANANTAIFYFSYESPYCNGPDDENLKSVSGATLRATNSHVDFSLLELLEPVPVLYHPYYAGWDINPDPPASAYCIHHPQGDVKKISIENDPPVVASFGDSYDPNKHWLVNHWESGTTEAGSSGAGLFDPDNHLRGTLTGGLANCSNSVKDYFQMFGHEWKDYPLPANQLEYWLDPLDINTSLIDGFDPNAGFWKTGDTLSNIKSGEELDVNESNLAWGSWSGHNSIPLSQFAEHFTHNHREKIMGVILQVAHDYIGRYSSGLKVKIWKDQEVPGQVLYEKSVLLADMAANMNNFIEFDSAVSAADSFFAGYEIFYNQPVDTFSTFMARNRVDNPLNTAYVFDNRWQSLEDYTSGLIHSSFGIMPVVYDSASGTVPKFEFLSGILIHPNPATTFCWIEFKEMQAFPVRIRIYNLQGEFIEELYYGPYQRSIKLETTKFRNGIYIVRVIRGDRVETAKIVIAR